MDAATIERALAQPIVVDLEESVGDVIMVGYANGRCVVTVSRSVLTSPQREILLRSARGKLLCLSGAGPCLRTGSQAGAVRAPVETASSS